MKQRINWSASPEELGAPADEELKALASRVSPLARTLLMEAALHLDFAKRFSDDKTPWRELVEIIRQNDPESVELEVLGEDGSQWKQVAYVERARNSKGKDERVLSAVQELVRALEVIDREKDRNQMNGRAGGRPSIKQDDIRQSVARVTERHGTKKLMEQPISWIIERVRFDWHGQHGAEVSPPSDNTIRRTIELCLPDHPKVKKKICKKPGS